MPIVTQAARHFQKPWALVAKYLFAKLLIPQRWTDGCKAQQEHSDDPRFVGVCDSGTPRPLLPVSMAVVEVRGLAECLLPAASLLRRMSPQSARGPPYRKYPASYFRVPHLIAPGRVQIENFLDSRRVSSQIICPRAQLSLINSYICMSPVIIHIWSQCHLLTLCFALSVRGNKCFVGQQKQPADGFSEWCWHTDNAQQLQAYKIILKIASYYASEHIKMSIFSLWHLK